MEEPLTIDPPFELDRDADRPSEGELDALFDRVAADTVDRPTTVRDRLRELPTRSRVALAAVGAVGFGVLVLALLGVRPAPTGAGFVTYVLTLCCLVAMVSIAVAISLRGADQRPAGRVAWSLTALALVAPLGLALMPGVWSDAAPPSVAVSGPGLTCLLTGLATAAGVGLLIRLFQRSDRPADWRLSATAGAGGLIAFTTVQLHCPSVDPLHLVVGHGLAGLLLAAALIVLARIRYSTQ